MKSALRTIAVGVGLALLLGSAVATPYDAINAEAATSVISAKPLRGGVVMLEGSGGNMAVFPGPDGLFIADIGIAVSQKKLMAKLKAIHPGLVYRGV